MSAVLSPFHLDTYTVAGLIHYETDFFTATTRPLHSASILAIDAVLFIIAWKASQLESQCIPTEYHLAMPSESDNR